MSSLSAARKGAKQVSRRRLVGKKSSGMKNHRSRMKTRMTASRRNCSRFEHRSGLIGWWDGNRSTGGLKQD
jgi:hypothetical protein